MTMAQVTGDIWRKFENERYQNGAFHSSRKARRLALESVADDLRAEGMRMAIPVVQKALNVDCYADLSRRSFPAVEYAILARANQISPTSPRPTQEAE
jgi:hypothetical protein